MALALAPSRRLAWAIALAACATLLLLALMPGPAAARLGAGAWCVAMACRAVRLATRARRVRIEGGDRVSIEEDGIFHEGRIVSGSFVAPWLTIVLWRPEGARFSRTLVIVPDMADAERFRALRVVLRWAPPH